MVLGRPSGCSESLGSSFLLGIWEHGDDRDFEGGGLRVGMYKGHIGIYRDICTAPIVENQMAKVMEHEMETATVFRV